MMHSFLASVSCVVVLLLAGCASQGSESLMNQGADWPPMTITKTEMMRQLGPPRSRTVTIHEGQTSEIFVWTYAEAQAHPALFIPIVGLAVAASGNGVNGEARSFTATFGPSGQLISHTWSQHAIGHQDGSEGVAAERPARSGYDPTAAGSQ